MIEQCKEEQVFKFVSYSIGIFTENLSVFKGGSRRKQLMLCSLYPVRLPQKRS